MPPFEYSGLKSLDKILQEGPRDILSCTALRVSTYLYVMHDACDEISWARILQATKNWMVAKAWERG